MPINFPDNPTLNEEFTSAGKTWKWNGFAWDAITLTPVGATGATGVVGSNGSTGATGAGITTGSVDNAVLRANGTGGATLQNSDILIDDATTSTQNNVAITNQHSGQTNSSIVISPKGGGAFILGSKPDGNILGGNARGNNAVDLQTSRSAATQVASGSASVIGGGLNNQSDSNVSVICGGQSNRASATRSAVLGGGNALADRYGMRAYSAGQFEAQGDAQDARFVLRCITTNATPVEMTLDGATTYLGIPSGKMMAMTINIAGISALGPVAHYIRQYAVRNILGFSTQVYAPVTIGSDNPSGTSIALSANDSDDTMRILVTGTSGVTWRWVATVDAIEIELGT
jgi:hypothetical protein